MSSSNWSSFVSLLEDEKIVYENPECIYSFQNGYFKIQGHLIVTDKRIIIIEYKLKKVGFFSDPKRDGYLKVGFEHNLSDIVYIKMIEKVWVSDPQLLFKLKGEDNIVLYLNDDDMLKKYYVFFSTLLAFSKEPSIIRQETVQYNISTKFEFSKDGGLLIQCPNCGGSTTLQSKTNPVRCPYCKKEYIMPNKLLELI